MLASASFAIATAKVCDNVMRIGYFPGLTIFVEMSTMSTAIQIDEHNAHDASHQQILQHYLQIHRP
jgi:hypothetical protein